MSFYFCKRVGTLIFVSPPFYVKKNKLFLIIIFITQFEILSIIGTPTLHLYQDPNLDNLDLTHDSVPIEDPSRRKYYKPYKIINE